jgi:hypothetical protein
MIRKLFTLLAITLAPLASAADPALVVESAAPFDGAIESISSLTTIAHLPGYGLNVNGRGARDYELEVVVDQLRNIVVGLSALVRGLDDNDWVSVHWQGKSFMADADYVVVRVKPGLPDTLEIYVNGTLLD